MARKLIVYIACSVDGYIAKPNDDLSFLSIVEQEGEDYGYEQFVSGIDTVIMGRKTYDWVKQHVEVPHADKTLYVITRTPRAPKGKTHFYADSLQELVQDLKNKPGKNIFCDGGAEIVNALLKYELVDELRISVIPILLGKGTRLFSGHFPEQNLKLISSQSFEKGLVQLCYKVVKS